MSRKLTQNRWNWDDNSKQWIFIELTEEGEKYYYQVDPPKEFIELTMKIKELNDKLILTKDPEENAKLFDEMMKISKRLQCMRKNDEECKLNPIF